MKPRAILAAALVIPLFAGADPAPKLSASAYVDPRASLVGNAVVGDRVFIAPGSSVRAGQGAPVVIGDESSVQDGAVVVGMSEVGLLPADVLADIGGVRIGRRTTVAAQAQVHGPARVGDGVFIGMRALVFNAEVGDGCVLEPGAMVMGVRVPPGRYIPASLVVSDQDAADALPRTHARYAYRGINERMVLIYAKMAEEYSRKPPER